MSDIQVNMDQLHALHQKRVMAKVIFDGLAMTNTIGLTAEQQVELDIRYRAAWLSYEAAHREYDELMDRYARERIDA